MYQKSWNVDSQPEHPVRGRLARIRKKVLLKTSFSQPENHHGSRAKLAFLRRAERPRTGLNQVRARDRETSPFRRMRNSVRRWRTPLPPSIKRRLRKKQSPLFRRALRNVLLVRELKSHLTASTTAVNPAGSLTAISARLLRLRVMLAFFRASIKRL